jgi:flavin reductase (DIM6/NTAB) family NADH-FMN oxidoreductase RutF
MPALRGAITAAAAPAPPRRSNVDEARFRDALSRWASGVTIVAVNDGGRVVGTTVSAFMSLSLDPPLVLAALGRNATVLPFLEPGAAVGISILAREQARLATVFADPFPVGPDPFLPGTPPRVRDALVALTCTVRDVSRVGDHTLITAEVTGAVVGAEQPLLRFRRRYRGLEK